ncbi:hypothetical protein BOTBODRAFT_50158 [Botryobasidium botryosum FD-172 SS1]|uniref:SEC7 domain-containing protein n=1 Tax=Botryobasidium botryosum (strain FD-172 SS1) TaxID=930990 RepID=A0A067NBM7_BOTB1|nr:hypothetical protein BOTBODRAFT_50158 [Botryobasidium botryosum FD-172 SS1]
MASFFRPSSSPHPRPSPRIPSFRPSAPPASPQGLTFADFPDPNNRRVSRTDIDFEQALRMDSTVMLTEGRDVNALGAGALTTPPPLPSFRSDLNSSSPSSSHRGPSSHSRSYHKQSGHPPTPIIVPPTPDERPDHAAAPVAPPSRCFSPFDQSYDVDDHDLQTKRRSMFRSPGTSSSPDLAALVRKARERGGIVNPSPDGLPGFRLEESADADNSVPHASSSRAAYHLAPGPSEHHRLKPSSSSSSLYSIVSSPSHSTVKRRPSTEELPDLSTSPSPSNASRTMKAKTAKAEKVLGVTGGFNGSSAGSSPDRSMSKTVGREAGKGKLKTQTRAFFGKMLGHTVREKSSKGDSHSMPNSPKPQVSPPLMSAFDHPPPQPFGRSPMPPGYQVIPMDVFTSPPTSHKRRSRSKTTDKPLPPIQHPPSDDEGDIVLFRTDSMPTDPPDKGPVARLRQNPNAKSGALRRRSLSVGDLKTTRSFGVPGSSQRTSSDLDKPMPETPQSDEMRNSSEGPRSSISGSPLRDWDIAMKGILKSDFSREFTGLTTPPSPSQPSPSSRPQTADVLMRSLDPEPQAGSAASRLRRARSNTTDAAHPAAPSPLRAPPLVPQRSTPHLGAPSAARSLEIDRSQFQNFGDAFPPPPTTSIGLGRPSFARRPSTGGPPLPPGTTKTTDSGIILNFTPRTSSLRHGGRPTVTASTFASANPRVASLRTQSRTGQSSTSSSTKSRKHADSGLGSGSHFRDAAGIWTSGTSSVHESPQLRIQSHSAASSSEPALVPVPPSAYGRPSVDDEHLMHPGRSTIRLVSSPHTSEVPLSPISSRRTPETSTDDLPLSRYSLPPVRTGSIRGDDIDSRGKELAAKCWAEDDTFLTQEKIAEWLGGIGEINKIALQYYVDYFDFANMRLDAAFRHLVSKLYLKAETQQVDRILYEFSRRYWECNPGTVYGSIDVIHAVTYSLLLLNTDLHVADLASHMSRNQFLRNTMATIHAQQERQEMPRPTSPDSVHEDEDGVHGIGSEGTESISDSAPSTVRSRSKRSESVTSWQSITKDVLPLGADQSSPQLSAPSKPSSKNPPASPSPAGESEPRTFGRSSFNLPSYGTNGKSWDSEIEAVLKEMYTAVKNQQILMPQLTVGRTSMSSLSPQVVLRARSQRSFNGQPDRLTTLKRGSIRGLQTLLGNQSPYGSNSSGSVDGRISPSPSFATSVGDGLSAASSTLFAPTLGFASNLSHTIIKEAQEDDTHSLGSANTASTSVSITDEELALLGAPWAKEGMLQRKQYWESTGKRAKGKSWMSVFVVIQKGELSMFTFGDGGGSGFSGGSIGGGNWLSNAQPVGKVLLAHALAHSLPPPGYNRNRPYCFVLTLSNGGVYFFQAGTEDLVNEWVSTCNYWAARQSKEPLSGGVSNMEYGWNRIADALQSEDSELPRALKGTADDSMSIRSHRSKLTKRNWPDGSPHGTGRGHGFTLDRAFVNEWKAPMPPTIASTHDEEAQMEALQKQASSLKQELEKHNELHQLMLTLYQPRSANTTKALANWERKSQYLLTEIVKYDHYVDSLRTAMTLRLKRRGDKVLEQALSGSPTRTRHGEENTTANSERSGVGKLSIGMKSNAAFNQEDTIQETEEPVTPVPSVTTFAASHRRERAEHNN